MSREREEDQGLNSGAPIIKSLEKREEATEGDGPAGDRKQKAGGEMSWIPRKEGTRRRREGRAGSNAADRPR